MCHTILLMQMNSCAESRIYFEYETIDECISSICSIYQRSLQRCGINIIQLYNFINDFKDIVCLVHRKESNSYEPHNKEWIKEQLYKLLVLRECI